MNIFLKYSIDKIGLPLIVTSSKPYLCFLIDTGATHNVIFSYVYDSFQHLFSATQDTLSLMGINGEAIMASQVEASLSFEESECRSTFSILDATEAMSQVQKESGIQIHGILGIPFLTQNKWILNFRDLTLQI